jgi:hypothetical protein
VSGIKISNVCDIYSRSGSSCENVTIFGYRVLRTAFVIKGVILSKKTTINSHMLRLQRANTRNAENTDKNHNMSSDLVPYDQTAICLRAFATNWTSMRKVITRVFHRQLASSQQSLLHRALIDVNF